MLHTFVLYIHSLMHMADVETGGVEFAPGSRELHDRAWQSKEILWIDF